MRDFLKIDPSVSLFGALLLLTLPVNWILAALMAAAFHEACHFLTIYLLGGHVWEMRIGIGGAVIEMEPMGKGRELLCALAGPAGSLLLVALCRLFPRLAICAGAQAIFNLLPIFPLDGGRALHCVAEVLVPRWADRISRWVETGAVFGIGVLAVLGTAVYHLGIFPILMALVLILKAVLRKRPCKAARIGVQ